MQEIGRDDAAGEFVAGEIAEAEAEVVNAVGGAGAMGFGEALRGFFDCGDGVGVEQFAQVGFAEQLAELILVDGEGLGAALGQRRVAIVEEVGHVAEEERRGKGRGLAGFDDVDAELPLFDFLEDFDQGQACRRHRGDTRDRPRAAAGTRDSARRR